MHANDRPRVRSLGFMPLGGGGWDTMDTNREISVVSLCQRVAGTEGFPPTFAYVHAR